MSNHCYDCEFLTEESNKKELSGVDSSYMAYCIAYENAIYQVKNNCTKFKKVFFNKEKK